MNKTGQFLILCIALLCSLPLQAANITASVDRNPVSENDSFQLTLEADASPDDDPDFTPLKTDFQILNQSQSQNASYINGSFSRTIRWNLTLMAKHTGTLTIPSIHFGKDTSPQLRLTVNSGSASTSQATQQPVTLTASLSKKSVWEQSQVVYTLKLLSRVNLSGVDLSDPEFKQDEVIAEPMGKEKRYQTQINGVAHLVIEKSWALFPQKPGKLTIAPVIGRVQLQRRSSNSFFDPFAQGQIRSVRSDSVSLEVKPHPANIQQSQWLPSKEVRLVEEWSPDEKSFKVGEPVTRTITLFADGALSSQIPSLSQGEIHGIKQYPDQPTLKNQLQDDGIIGARSEKIALIPANAGDYTLPAIEIPWFNTQTGKQEIARIPAHRIKVTGSATAVQNTPAVMPIQSTPVVAQTSAVNNQTSPVWKITTAGFAIAWLVTLGLWIFVPRKKVAKQKPVKEKSVSHSQARKKVEQACKQHDAVGCKNALIEWGQMAVNHDIHSLGNLAAHVDNEFSQALQQLNASLYSASASDWQGNDIARCLSAYKSDKKDSSTTNSKLEPLYR